MLSKIRLSVRCADLQGLRARTLEFMLCGSYCETRTVAAHSVPVHTAIRTSSVSHAVRRLLHTAPASASAVIRLYWTYRIRLYMDVCIALMPGRYLWLPIS